MPQLLGQHRSFDHDTGRQKLGYLDGKPEDFEEAYPTNESSRLLSGNLFESKGSLDPVVIHNSLDAWPGAHRLRFEKQLRLLFRFLCAQFLKQLPDRFRTRRAFFGSALKIQ